MSAQLGGVRIPLAHLDVAATDDAPETVGRTLLELAHRVATAYQVGASIELTARVEGRSWRSTVPLIVLEAVVTGFTVPWDCTNADEHANEEIYGAVHVAGGLDACPICGRGMEHEPLWDRMRWRGEQLNRASAVELQAFLEENDAAAGQLEVVDMIEGGALTEDERKLRAELERERTAIVAAMAKRSATVKWNVLQGEGVVDSYSFTADMDAEAVLRAVRADYPEAERVERARGGE